MSRTIAIIGAGKAGRVFARRLRECGWRIGAVVTRSAASARRAARFIGGGSPSAEITARLCASRAILIATPDSAIPGVTEQLAKVCGAELGGRIVLHTSGCLSSNALTPARECGAAVGSIHVMQTFTGVGSPSMEGRVFGIEGDAAAVRVARRIARDLGGLPVQIAGSAKSLYHCAAVVACAQVLALMEASTRLLMSIGMKRREAVRALLPLTRQVLQNFERLGPTASWTGPLARGDYGIIETHQRALRKFPPEYREAYDALNRLAAEVLAPDREAVLAQLNKISAQENSRLMTTTGGKA
jgi:predicted short-subunit dehydrogenase-like oxidoreductase (DUF2520 family)